MEPLFITLESLDGLGKTTQITLLENFLESKGLPVYRTKEPGDQQFGSVIGPDIRNILFAKGGTIDLAPGVSDLLFLADHVQNSHDVRCHLDKGDWVISDRYADSQFAYSFSGTKRAPQWTYNYYLEQFGVIPHLTVILIAQPNEKGSFEWALGRARKRSGPEEGKQEGKAWNKYEEQVLIQQGYVYHFGDFGAGVGRNHVFVPVEQEETENEVFENIRRAIKQNLFLRFNESAQIFKK